MKSARAGESDGEKIIYQAIELGRLVDDYREELCQFLVIVLLQGDLAETSNRRHGLPKLVNHASDHLERPRLPLQRLLQKDAVAVLTGEVEGEDNPVICIEATHFDSPDGQ